MSVPAGFELDPAFPALAVGFDREVALLGIGKTTALVALGH
jgi:hypothetical protein